MFDNHITAVILLVIGFVLLIKGADFLIRGSVAIAKHLGVSELLIGMTVIAFGTSLPELVINLLANNENTSALAIGNIIGANIANTWFILGIAAIIIPLVVHRLTVWREILFSVGASLVLLVLVADQAFGRSGFSGLDRADGLILLALFGAFIYYIAGKFRRNALDSAAERLEEFRHGYSLTKSILFAVAGAAALGFGGHLIVDNGASLAEMLGIGTGIIGLTIVALGTTAPELTTVLAAVRQRKTDLAIGGVVGSTIFNTLLVLGISSLWRPLPFDATQFLDASIAAMAVILLFLVLLFNRKGHILDRPAGVMFLVFYVVYLFYLIIRT
jgi:cation:H+ antiporter